MSTQVRTQEQQSGTEPQDLSNLSFADYEKARNGQKPASANAKPAPAEDDSAEQESAEESGTSEPAAQEESEDETEAEDQGDESESEAEDAEKEKPAKKKGGFQRKIDKLTARSAAAEARAAAAEEELARVRSGSDKTKVEKPSAADAPGKPKPADFESHEEYLDALTDWKYETRKKADDAAAEQKRLEADRKKQFDTFKDRRKTFEAKNPDFDDVMDEVEDIKVSPDLVQLLVESENGPELMYELAKNRAEYERINALSRTAAARELGKFEAKLADRAAKAAVEKKEKQVTKTPKPIAPIGGGKAGVVEESIYDKNLPFEKYERIRLKDMRRKQG
jgi:hypothetical protein